MGLANTVIDHPDEYWAIVKQHQWLFVLFVSEYCEACQGANKRFERISEEHAGIAKSITLNTVQTPRIETLGNIVTPTLVVYKNNEEVERYLGIGFPEDQEDYLRGIFSHYLNGTPLPVLPTYLYL